MHYYKKNIGDYAKKAGRLTMLQHGAYTLLLDSCYDREVFPTLDEAIEWTWASSKEEVEAVEFVLKKFFVLEDGRYVQSRIQEELEKFHANSETNKRIAKEREAKRKENSTKRAPSVNEPPPNHKPLTKNQEPDIDPKGSRDFDGSKPPVCPVKEIVDLYNQKLPELPACTVLNDSRKKAIAARWREVVTTDKMTKAQGLEFFDWFFTMVRDSDFLMGRKKEWKADIDFLFTASKFPRIVEGVYHRSEK